MSASVEIKEDPGHPEGGHALIVFHGVAVERSFASLSIEALTDGFDYRGPRRLDVPVRSTGDGVEVSIGPDIVGNLKQGLAVNLALSGTGIAADALWPVLTPIRAAPRRRAMQTGAPRRVVVDNMHRPESVAPGPASTPLHTPIDVVEQPAEVRKPEVATSDVPVPDRFDQAPIADAVPVVTDAVATSITADRGHVIEPDGGKPLAAEAPPPTPGLRAPAVMAIACVAFAIGVGATSLLWFMMPAPAPRVVVGNADFRLPSPYEMLNGLSDHAPDGRAVDVGDTSSFRHRSETAASAEDASFWRKWATRGLLDSKTNDAAAILSNFAVDLVQTRADKPELAAARFVWEMAAIAKDCAAMDNIATALDVGGKQNGPEDPAIWRKRAESCRSQNASGH